MSKLTELQANPDVISVQHVTRQVMDRDVTKGLVIEQEIVIIAVPRSHRREMPDREAALMEAVLGYWDEVHNQFDRLILNFVRSAPDHDQGR
jgi:hypothetical protein